MPDDDLFNLVEEADEDKDAAGEPQEDASVGQRLRAQRRQRGVSLYQAAQELRIDPAVLRAIEADDFSLLGAPVYIKGHLRKYATLLGLSPESVFDDYARTHELSESTPVVNRAVDPGRPHKSGYWLRVIAMLLIIVAIGAATAWWSGRSESVPDSVALTAGNDGTPARALTIHVPLAGNDTRDDDARRETAARIEPDVLPVQETAIASTGAAVRIDLVFSGDSWIEMTDADGDQLMFGLVDAGTEHSIEGAPPIDVLLGSADAVLLEVAGEPYVISPGNVRDGVARFSIEGP